MTQSPPPQPPKKGTLSLGSTLSVSSAPRTGGSGVAVEVRKRRFDGPTPAQPAATTTEESQRRQQALANAQGSSFVTALPEGVGQRVLHQAPSAPAATPSASPQTPASSPAAASTPARVLPTLTSQMSGNSALQMAAQLQESRIKSAQAKAEQDQIDREKAKIDAELAAIASAARRAGSGAGGVQSGTLAGGASAAARRVDMKDFSRKATDGEGVKSAEKPGKRGRNAYKADLAERARTSGGGNRRRGRNDSRTDATTTSNEPAEKIIRDVQIPAFITVGELASRMSEKASDVIKKLMQMGEFVTVNQTIDQATAELLVTEMGHRFSLQVEVDLEAQLREADDTAEQLIARAPIVTIMGHVDHGKTTLLDTLRKTKVASGEAGGITQHVGAYQITAPSGRLITFLDTPGHAAFTAMRARGAKVTDVVILVVAADDGIMPQTIEAIQHAKAAGVPLVVALNKMDKPNVNPARVKNDLLAQDVVIEEFGGTVPCVPVSGLTGLGLAELEEIVLLQADVLDLKANPNRRAEGSVVESRLDKGRGPIATVIVQNGTLQVGDILVAGAIWGRVRALINDQGKTVKTAGPSMPVQVLGLQGVPTAGDTFIVAADEKKAKEVAQLRDVSLRERAQAERKMTLEGLMERLSTGDQHELNVIIKTDVQGSVEAINFALSQLNADQQQVRVKVISGGVGVVTENDVNLAVSAKALVIGFNVRADATARDIADNLAIEIRYYSIIYQLVDDIKAAMTGLLAPSSVEEITGTAEIRQVFVFNKRKIAGCMATSGKLSRGSKVRILRGTEVIYTGELATLRRGKEDVKEVASGFECGMTFAAFTEYHTGDVVEAYTVKEVKRTLDDLKRAGQAATKAAKADQATA